MNREQPDPPAGGDRIRQTAVRAGGDVIGKKVEHHHHHPAGPVTALHALPAPPAGFTGRDALLEELLAAVDPDTGDRAGVVVSAVAGMGGVGKTALALVVGAAARQRGWFCAELFVDLRGYTPGAQPVDANAALDTLLRALGVDVEKIPPALEERAAFYRSALAALSDRDEHRRPVLVVADNAAAVEQVRPLLPGPGGHRLLVTSRSTLHSLAGARRIDVDVLTPQAAVALLAAILGADDSRSGRTEELAEVARWCGYLPLALEISAALLVRAPHLDPARLARRLAQEGRRLERLDDGERTVRAVFDLSVQRLTPGQARVFALLGVNPGPDIATEAAAVLTGLEAEEAEEVLQDLAGARLLTSHPGGRWSMHDLLTDHARHHLTHHTGTEVEAARRRLLDHYTRLTADAAIHLQALPGEAVPATFTGTADALAWLDTEFPNLSAAAYAAQHAGHTDIAVALPLDLGVHLDRRRRFDELISLSTLARDTARTTGRTKAEAAAWNNLGAALAGVRRFQEAIEAHTTARTLYQQTGDRHREANAVNSLGAAFLEARRFEEAVQAYTTARTLHQESGDRRREAAAVNSLGLALAGVRRFEEAVQVHTTARALFREAGDRHGVAMALDSLGTAFGELRRFEEAIEVHTTARALFQETGDPHREAMAQNNLGLALAGVRRFEEAIEVHTTARTLYREAGDRHGEAMAWNNLGNALAEVHRFEEAAQAHNRARALFREAGDRHGEAMAWNNLGNALAEVHRFEEAVQAHTTARALFSATGDRYGEAMAWANLGTGLHKTGRSATAVSALERAARGLEGAGDTYMLARVRERLAALRQGPGGVG